MIIYEGSNLKWYFKMNVSIPVTCRSLTSSRPTEAVNVNILIRNRVLHETHARFFTSVIICYLMQGKSIETSPVKALD